MSRYYFHVIDGKIMIDREGSDHPGIDQAREEAIETAGHILRTRGGDAGKPWRLIVADADENVVFTLDFSSDRHGL
jgi:hypothetical protein